MPKFAILSDIHANAEALSVVLEQCRALGLTKFISLGDIVGYNADPVRCMDMVRDLDFAAMVIGNHDYYATGKGDTELSGFNPTAKLAITWTRNQLDEARRHWLDRQERATLAQYGITIVHATLDTPLNWGYIFERHHAEANFSYQYTQICFCGHSHVPVAFEKLPMAAGNELGIIEMFPWINNEAHPELDADFTQPDSLTVEYKSGHKYLFNIGSIGQPRNGDPRASFAVLDTDKHTVTRYRLPYDIPTAQQKILDAKLPERLARRIAIGN